MSGMDVSLGGGEGCHETVHRNKKLTLEIMFMYKFHKNNTFYKLSFVVVMLNAVFYEF